MANITIRNLPDEVHRAIRVLAARNRRSTEAEVRALLARGVSEQVEAGIGTELRKFGEAIGGVELKLRRDKAPIEPARFD